MHALILPDRPTKDDALIGVVDGALDKPVAVADGFGGDEDAFSVEAIQEIAEALTFFADQIFGRDEEVVEKDLRGVVVHHRAHRLDGEAVAGGLAHVDQQE